jgi:hypothetical protein
MARGEPRYGAPRAAGAERGQYRVHRPWSGSSLAPARAAKEVTSLKRGQ